MAYFLFLDESGQDHHESPYEVLAGVTIEDRDLWNMVKTVQEAEERFFGCRYTKDRQELQPRSLKAHIGAHATATIFPGEGIVNDRGPV